MTLASTSFLGLSGLKLDIKQSPQRLVFTPSVTAEGKTSYISGAHNAKIALGSDSDTVRVDVTVASGQPQRSTLAGTSNSTFRTRQGSDTMLFRVSAADPITGIGVAVQNTFISGNSGDDSIHMEAAAGKTRLWGRQAVVFGGAGNDVVTGVGSAQNCFI